MSEQPLDPDQTQAHDADDEALGPAVPGGGPTAAERPPSRKAAWLAMGAVGLALGLIWVAPGINDHAVRDDGILDGDLAALEESEMVGKPAPLDFTLKDMHGRDVHLASFTGKVILINFWATWCAPCKAEIPGLVELQEQYAGDLVVLGLSIDDTADKLLAFAEAYDMNYPVLVGLGHDDVLDAYGPLWGIPVSVIVDRDGIVAVRHALMATKEQFEREITALL
jgi:thiol-disulfide isomerase/thioredoxin